MMPMGASIHGVLFTVLQSILQVFLLCFAGFTLTFKGIVDKPASRVLNHINIALFTPALLFSKVAFFLTPAKLRQLWVIPIFFTVLTGISAVTAHWLARAFRLKRSQVIFATAASMFMNANSLPVALMQSLVATVPLLRWGPDDTVDAMFGRSLTYLVVFSTLGMILRWSYGIHLISQADEPVSATPPPPTTYRDADLPLIQVTPDPPATAQPVDFETETNAEPRPLRSPHPRLTTVSRGHTHWRVHLHSHLPAAPTSLGDQSESEDSDEIEMTEDDSEDTVVLQSEPTDTGPPTRVHDPAPAPLPSEHPSSRPRWDHQTRSSPLSPFTRLLNTLTSLSPPLIASLLAIFCVVIPPIQQLLKSKGMTPFEGALENAGACSVPLTLIVLGGWFWDGETESKVEGKIANEFVGQVNGKGIEDCSCHGTETLAAERPRHSHTCTENTPSSRDSSAASLSSMVGAFGDVLMARIHLGCSGQTKRQVGEGVESDVEAGPLATHAETENESPEHALGRSSRPPSRTDRLNGRQRLSSTTSSSSTFQLPEPQLPRARGGNPPGETLTVVVALLARMVIVPLIVTPMIVLIIRLGWGGQVFKDPVFIVSSMLLVASPPALTLAQISQRAKPGKGAGAGLDTDPNAYSPFERLLSRTVFWAYCVLTPPITILSVMAGLFLIGA